VPTTAGSGATLCTAADLGRFLRAVVAGDPPLLEPGTREAMLTLAIPLPEGRRYGYGLGVELDTEAGYRRAGHQGDCPGYHSYAYGCLETGVGVAALANGPGGRTPLPGGGFRVGDDPASPDRVHFTAVVEGRPMRAPVSGWPYDRVD
jgi:Beta-lactamase